jgi:tRNA-splicing ligase RtcB
MIKEIKTGNLPIKLWLKDIDEIALNQAKNLAVLPFAFKHIAIMPDAHAGYGMPIGGVLATKDVVIPNAVGVDIGCGMCAVRTNLTEISTVQLKEIMKYIRKNIPLGFNKHKERQEIKHMPKLSHDHLPIVSKEYSNALKQIGTLGGGNHFIDILRGSDNYIWIMVHSGSRNLGYTVAKHYNSTAIKINKDRGENEYPEKELAYLLADSKEGKLYIEEMQYCVEFALANRKLMIETIINSFKKLFGGFDHDPIINIAHNYASLEEHFGEKAWLHRKGATSAGKDEIGIIPGSQGTNSYIVKGKGNPESFKSCSHGAGRKMSRSAAIRSLDLEEEKKKLEAKGILHGIRHKDDLDEASNAYKDINQVMENQKDLVEIIVELTPIAVIQG